LFINEIELAKVLIEISSDRDGNPPEDEGVCVDVFECVLLLVLDDFLEGADQLCPFNLDWKDVGGVIAEKPAVEN
jgi:hypothetical protein